MDCGNAFHFRRDMAGVQMRIALGDIQAFADAPSLLAYCASNPDAEAGYAPQGQGVAQTLPCQQWPYVLPPSQIVLSGATLPPTTSTSTFTSMLTSSAIGGIPNWLLIGGLIAIGIFAMRRGA